MSKHPRAPSREAALPLTAQTAIDSSCVLIRVDILVCLRRSMAWRCRGPIGNAASVGQRAAWNALRFANEVRDSTAYFGALPDIVVHRTVAGGCPIPGVAQGRCVGVSLRAQIAYNGEATTGEVRHASFKGLEEQGNASAVLWSAPSGMCNLYSITRTQCDETNGAVAPIHPKAMPVLLTTAESSTCGCARPGLKQRWCSDRCRKP